MDSADIETLMKASLDKMGKPKTDESPLSPKLEEIKEVATEGQANTKENTEESKVAPKTMDELLGAFEKEMDIEELDSVDQITNQAKVVAELNLLKQTST